MKAMELAVAQEDRWRKIAISLIDPVFKRRKGAKLCHRLVATVTAGSTVLRG
jgi:hypothetical protein